MLSSLISLNTSRVIISRQQFKRSKPELVNASVYEEDGYGIVS